MFLRSRGSKRKEIARQPEVHLLRAFDTQNLCVAEERSFTRHKPFQAAVRFF